MIPFGFDYWRPQQLQAAVEAYHALRSRDRNPFYYSGGTEIITIGRIGHLVTDAVLDIKEIPECNVIGWSGEQLVLGAALSLNQLTEMGEFPLLGALASRIADHTTRNKITFGGNLCSWIPYREAVLPLLLADSHVVLASAGGYRVASIHEVFAGHMRLRPGELVVQVLTRREATRWPYVTLKKTKQEEVDYPLVRLAVVHDGRQIRAAFSAVCAEPFRSSAVEDALNEPGQTRDTRIRNAIARLPAPVVQDMRGSAEFRAYVLFHALKEALSELEGGVRR